MILPPGTVHEYAADVDDPWSIYWVHFEGKLSQEFYDHIGLHSASENIGFEQTIVSIFESNFELRRTHYDIDAFILGAHNLHRLLSLIALLKKQRKHPTGIEINLNEVREIMLDHIHGQLSLDVLSEKVQLSKYYFSKRFKTLTGESPMQYFSNLKIQRACQLLDKTPQTIKHIALSLGYDDAYYFSRLFKKTVGLSPKQYRESNHR